MSQHTEMRGGDPASLSRDPKMNLSLLLDLDDTLLDSNLDSFLPAYFQALSGYLKNQVEPELMLSALFSVTRTMMANNDPSRTLRQIFESEFFPKVGLVREELQPRIDQFYVEVFPTLSYLTRPRPEAVEVDPEYLALQRLLQGCQRLPPDYCEYGCRKHSSGVTF